MNIKEETNNALVYLSHWWGLHKPGYAGIAIKQDGTVIQFVNDFQAGDFETRLDQLDSKCSFELCRDLFLYYKFPF